MHDQKLSVQESYLEQMVESAGKDGLLLLLADGAVKFIRRALFALEKENLDDVHNYLVKAQNIYMELVITLDLDAGDFAENLALVYQFIYNLLIEANLEKNKAKIESGLKLAEDIRDLWKETVQKARLEFDEDAEDAKAVKAGVSAIEKQDAVENREKVQIYTQTGMLKVLKSGMEENETPSRLNITG